MERLLAILTKLAKMPERDLTPILGLFESIDVPAKKALLAPDTICLKVWIVSSGSIRAYTLEAAQFFTLSHRNYKTLLSASNEVGWKVFEQVTLMAEQRVIMSNLRYLEDRLKMMESTFAGLMRFLPVHIQASYLNMEANALSKLRSR